MLGEKFRIPLTKGEEATVLCSHLPKLEGKITFHDKELEYLLQLRDEVNKVMERLQSVDGMEAYLEAFNAWKMVLQKFRASKVLMVDEGWREDADHAEKVTELVGRGLETIHLLFKEVGEIRKDIEYGIDSQFGKKKDEAIRKALRDPSVADVLTKALEAAGVIFE